MRKPREAARLNPRTARFIRDTLGLHDLTENPFSGLSRKDSKLLYRALLNSVPVELLNTPVDEQFQSWLFSCYERQILDG